MYFGDMHAVQYFVTPSINYGPIGLPKNRTGQMEQTGHVTTLKKMSA